jgi:hypothetical protein
MYPGFKLNMVATCILVTSFASVAKAQLASSKSLNVIYSKKINEKLDEKNKSKQLFKPLQKEQNLPSTRSSLKDVAKLKIKNPEIVAHSNSTRSDEEKKNKLASNSSTLKQVGIQAARSQKSSAR